MDREEALRRGIKPPRRTIKRHPYAAIEWRVLDSPAFADLTPSAVKVLMLLARQLTKENNNGHLQATFSFMSRFGIGSEHTVQDAIAQLISHGFVYRTRSHGANGAWAKYALTWLPIKNKKELFLNGFLPFAWEYWTPEEKKAPRKKCRTSPAPSADSAPDFLQKVQECLPQEVQTMYLVPVANARWDYKPQSRPRPHLASHNTSRHVTHSCRGWRYIFVQQGQRHDAPRR